jgi:hypothetical protein
METLPGTGWDFGDFSRKKDQIISIFIRKYSPSGMISPHSIAL